MRERFGCVEPIPQSIGERGPAKGAGKDGSQRHPDLHDSQEAAGIVHEGEGDARAVVAVRRQLLQPRPSRGQDRQLGHGKEAIQQDDKGDNGDL